MRERQPYNWLYLEVEEERAREFPNQTHPEDIKAGRGSLPPNIIWVTIKLLPDND